jgi:hypothetical protein
METNRKPQRRADGDLRAICRQIVSEGKTIEEWGQVESDDTFQRGKYVGGYDATEQQFLFSYHDDMGKEWWFFFPLLIAEKIARGDDYYLDLHEPS